jgi:hypothetical protein
LPIYPYLKDNNSEEMINPWNMKEQNNYLPELMMKIGQNQKTKKNKKTKKQKNKKLKTKFNNLII